MADPGYLSNAQLAQDVTDLVTQTKAFKDEQIDLYTSTAPTVTVTDAEGNPAEVPSLAGIKAIASDAAGTASEAATAADSATASANAAAAQAIAAAQQAPKAIYATVAAGLAATPVNMYFGYANTANSQTDYYVNQAGVAIYVFSEPSAAAISAVTPPNILPDSFNEFSANDLNFGQWAWYSTAVPTFTTTSANIPVATPVIQAGSTSVDKYHDFTLLNLVTGDRVVMHIDAYFASAGGVATLFWRDASNATLASTPVTGLAAGRQTVSIASVVPSGAVASVVARVTHALAAFEIGGYWMAKGVLPPSHTRGGLPAKYERSIPVGHNVLFDPFGEILAVRPFLTGLPGTNARYSGTYNAPSAVSPFGKPFLTAATGVIINRNFPATEVACRSGDQMTFRAAGACTASGSALTIYYRDVSGNVLATFARSLGAGAFDVSVLTIVPASTSYIEVRVSGNTDKWLYAVAAGAGLQRPAFDYSAVPGTLQRLQQTQRNLCPDPFYRQFDAGILNQDGYPLAQTGGLTIPPYVTDCAVSPFPRKRSLFLPSGGVAFDRYIDVKGLGLKLGDVVTVVLGVYAWQTVAINAFFRDAGGAVIASGAATNYLFAAAGQYREISYVLTITQAVIDSASYLDVRFPQGITAGANGIHICGWGIFTGDAAPLLYDGDYRDDQIRIDTLRHTDGLAYQRQTRHRLFTRRAGATPAFPAANQIQHVECLIGDSYTQQAARWCGAYAQYMKSATNFNGDAGPGWIGLGYTDGNLNFVNGNITDAFTYAITGTWTPTYGSASSPDICSASSSTVGSIYKVGNLPAGLSKLTLYQLGQSAGVIQVSVDGGLTWGANVDVSGAGLISTVITPPAGSFALWIKLVSGSCELYGLDAQTALPGARYHKLGATGTTLLQWSVACASPVWKAALAALAPNAVQIMLATNDQTSSANVHTFETNLITLVTAIRSVLPYADIRIVMPAENERGIVVTMAQFAQMARRVARKYFCAFVDLQPCFGINASDYAWSSGNPWLYSDNIHPTNPGNMANAQIGAGGYVIAAEIWRAATVG